MSANIPEPSYSTIFHCSQSFFVCFLRAFEGIISLVIFIFFLKGYKKFSTQQNNRLSAEDKNLYILAMFQTGLTTLYFLAFEEFFMLATVRNFLIWISINVLNLYIQLYFMKEPEKLKYADYIINALKVANFLSWFFISLGDGSATINTDISLGYNCQIPDWIFLSGFLLIMTLSGGYLGYSKLDRLAFELEHIDKSQKRMIESLQTQKLSITLLLVSSITGAVIMFFWDYFAFISSTTKQSCQGLFSGDTAFRNLLCFLLKVISMQFNPTVIYYIVYYIRKDEFNQVSKDDIRDSNVDYFDDAASDLNKTLTSRGSDRRSHSFTNRDANNSQHF